MYYDLAKNVSKDKTLHACQIPLDLVELLIKFGTKEGDDIFFSPVAMGQNWCFASN